MPRCPQCGELLPPDAPDGLCPKCVMAMNLKTETVFTDDTPAAQPPLPPEQIAPHFPQLEILECLGRGGMGVVYKARQKTLNRFVALKLLAPERVQDAKFAERFAREAQALAALNHPNIVTIHDFGQAGGFYYLLMEFVDGLNLRQLLRTQKFTPEEALAIVPPLCDALQFAHDRGIVHRDIKPENLLLDKAGKIKVADFGIAKMLGTMNGSGTAGKSAAPENVTQSAVGTPSYSAPEQKTDPQRVDSRADIYSLGVVFYELLTGELPGKKLEAPSKKVQIDVRLDEIVLRALEKNPELRYQHVSEVKTMVETIVATPGSAGVPPAEPGVAPGIFRPEAVKIARYIRATLTPKGLAWFARKSLLWFADQVLLLFDFTAKPQRYAFWPVLLLFCSNIGFIVNGLALAVALVQRLMNGSLSHGNIFVLSVQEHRMFLWLVFCAVARLTVLSLGSSVVTGAESGQITSGIRSRRVLALSRTLLALAALVLVTILGSRWLAAALSAASPAAIDTAGKVLWLVPICVAAFAPVVFWFLFRNAWGRTKFFNWANLHEKVKANIRPTLEFWQAIDAGKYALSWDAAAPMFQRTIGKEEWVAQMEKNRRPLGKVLSRKERSTKVADDGSSFEAVYLTSFDSQCMVVETVNCATQSNGEMCVISYCIKPDSSESAGQPGANQVTMGIPPVGNHGKVVPSNPLPVSDFWLALEEGNYARAWGKAAPYFQRDISQDEWVAKMEKERRPLGRGVDRKPVSVTFITPNTRTTTEVLTTFENGQQWVEGVISAVQPDGEWKVERYHIRPATQDALAQAKANEARLSRFSNTAIWGGCLLLIAIFIGYIGLLYTGANFTEPAVKALVGLCFLSAMVPAVAATILGWVAVAQIRKSAGKLCGLWLAVFDGLLFPLLALDAVIFGLIWLVIKLLIVGQPGDMLTIGYELGMFFALWLCLATLISVVLDWLIIRRVWQAVNKGSEGVPPPDASRRRGDEAQTEKSKTEKSTGKSSWFCSPLSSLESGQSGKIAYIHTRDNAKMQKMMAIGVVPGMKIKMLQNFPSFLFKLGNSQFAVDEPMAKDIFVRISGEEGLE